MKQFSSGFLMVIFKENNMGCWGVGWEVLLPLVQVLGTTSASTHPTHTPPGLCHLVVCYFPSISPPLLVSGSVSLPVVPVLPLLIPPAIPEVPDLALQLPHPLVLVPATPVGVPGRS